MDSDFIRLTHLRSGRPTFIDIWKITNVRESVMGETLVIAGGQGQYVAQTVQAVVDTVDNMRMIRKQSE